MMASDYLVLYFTVLLEVTVSVMILSLEQAAQVVRLYSNGDERAIASFFTMVFDEQEKILNRATAEMTQAQVEDIFANWATYTGVVSLEDFRRCESLLNRPPFDA